MDQLRPKVGIGLLLLKDDKVLLGKRKASHGVGEYGFPGGHLELMESFEDCALRELAEEAGDVQIKDLRYLCTTNLRKYDPKHYVDIGMVADWVAGEPKVIEPDKRENWDWYDMDKLPSPLFAADLNYIEAYKTGKTYFQA